MTISDEYRRINLQLRIRIETMATREEIELLCTRCQEPFEYADADNLKLAWLRDELEERNERHTKL